MSPDERLRMMPQMTPEMVKEEEDIKKARQRIKKTVLVLSGKGGVGKSTVAVNLAVAASRQGRMVGLLDIDLHGPSVPTLLGLQGSPVYGTPDEKLVPIQYSPTLKVMSSGFLGKNSEDPFIWRAAVKHSAIRQFVKDVLWEDLDLLVVDAPPGTGDEPLSIIHLLENPDGAIIVTTPQDVALVDVRKSVNFCKKLNIPVIGVIENMSGLKCPHCGENIDVFKNGGGKIMAGEMDVPFLGSIPLDPSVTNHGDSGKPILEDTDGAASKVIVDIIKKLIDAGTV